MPYSNVTVFTGMTRLAGLIGMTVVLAACSRTDRFTDLQMFVEEVKARPGAEVEPVPTFEPYAAFTYSAASLRSPFDIPIAILQNENAIPGQRVLPDFDRVRESLESHSIAQLNMVGMMERSRKYVALVEDELGDVHRVMIGNYMGRNHGKVVSISKTQMDLVEIVPSGDGGWVERPQTLALIPQQIQQEGL